MSEELQSILLENGLLVSFRDQTNRYYGDFHRVCIQVTLELPESLKLPDGISRDELKYERLLEKMGVQTTELDATRSNLINAYLGTSRAYLEKAGFPQQLLQNLRKAKKRPLFLR